MRRSVLTVNCLRVPHEKKHVKSVNVYSTPRGDPDRTVAPVVEVGSQMDRCPGARTVDGIATVHV
eukprot:6205437-Pleurochrysis_carterae.AAC.2